MNKICNVIQQIHQPVIEQQLSQNNIALYFAAVKLQANFASILFIFTYFVNYALSYVNITKSTILQNFIYTTAIVSHGR